MKNNLKKRAYDGFVKFIADKIIQMQKQMAELHESAKNETKSTAGDKHETALAMLQIEQENLRRQIKEAVEQKTVFINIDPALKGNEIRKGSLVETDKGYFFISTGIGKISIDQIIITSLSPASPLGVLLMGKKIKDEVEVNTAKYIIKNIE